MRTMNPRGVGIATGNAGTAATETEVESEIEIGTGMTEVQSVIEIADTTTTRRTGNVVRGGATITIPGAGVGVPTVVVTATVTGLTTCFKL